MQVVPQDTVVPRFRQIMLEMCTTYPVFKDRLLSQLIFGGQFIWYSNGRNRVRPAILST